MQKLAVKRSTAEDTEFMVWEQKGKRKVIKKYFKKRGPAEKFVDRNKDKALFIKEVTKY